MASSLPFGVGAPAGATMEREEDVSIESESSIEETVPETTSQEEEDPWALPPENSAPLLEATPSSQAGDSEAPVVVLKARAGASEEEQLSESPVFVENAFEINAATFDAEHVYAVEEDVVLHDFGDELQVSEIVVNFDEAL